MKARRSLPVLLLAAFSSAPAWAQAPEASSAVDPRRGYSVGRLRLYPRLLLHNAGVSTNVYNSRSRAIPDSSITLSPILEGRMPVGRRFRLQGQGEVDFTWFGRETSERSTDYFGRGTAEGDFGPATLMFGGGGGQYRQRASIDIDERLLRQEKSLEAGVTLRASRRISFGVGVGASEFRYEPGVTIQGSDVATTLDRDSRNLDASVSYRLSNQTTFTGSISLTEDRFLGETRPGQSLTQSRGYFGGFTFGPKAVVHGRLRAGIREYPVSRAGGLPAYRGPALGADLNVPILRFALLTLTADRDIIYAVGGAATTEGVLRNSYVSGRYLGNLDVALPLDLIGSVTAGFEQAKYLRPVVQGGVRFNRMDHLWTLGGSLTRRLGDHARLGVGATLVRRVSNLAGNSYQDVTYGLTGEFVP